MTETPNTTAETFVFQQSDFEKVTQVVSAEFQIEESLMEHGIPTYYLKQPQETKQAFLRLLKDLEPMKLIPLLRREAGKESSESSLSHALPCPKIGVKWS